MLPHEGNISLPPLTLSYFYKNIAQPKKTFGLQRVSFRDAYLVICLATGQIKQISINKSPINSVISRNN